MLLIALYGLRFWLLRQDAERSEWVLTLREGTQILQHRLQSPAFRAKVLQQLQQTQSDLEQEAREGWDTLKQLAREGWVRLQSPQSESIRKVAQAVAQTARSEGDPITLEARLTPPPTHWMIAVVTNLILLAWVVLGAMLLWGVTRVLNRHR